MELHTLRFRGIGPFPGEHEIDFDALAASRLFLLEGPTGSGKSTIIDAITFALYGQTAAAGTDEARLRSDLADPEVESYVELVFSTGVGTYRIRRSPRWHRPKKRGSGTVEVKQQVTLARLASPTDPGPGDTLTTRADEAGVEIARIVGLTKSQFVQTVVLPQGEFATFLHAVPEKRREVLQRVFGTELYDDAQAVLEQMRRDAKAQVQAAHQAIDNALARFAGAVGVPPDGDVLEPLTAARRRSDDEAVMDGLGGLVAALADAADEAATRLAAATTAHAEARDALTAAQALAADQDRLARLRADQQRLAQEHPVHVARVGQLDRARRAASVTSAADAARKANEFVADAHEVVAVATAELAELAELQAVPISETEARTGADDLAEQAARLDHPVGLEARLPGRGVALTDADTRILEVERTVRRLRTEIDARPELKAALEARIAELRQLAAVEPVAATEVDVARDRLAAARDVAALTELLESATVARDAARQKAERAGTAEHNARFAWRAGLAGELATALIDGEPCPVCGATDHPDPAVPAAGSVSGDDVDLAEQARREADSHFATAHAEVEKLTERLTARRAATAGLTESAAADALAAAADRRKAASAAAAELADAEAALAPFDAETARQREELTHAVTTHASLCAKSESDRAEFKNDEAAVVAARGDYPSAAARQAALRTAASALRSYAELLATAREADSAAQTRVTELAAACDDAGFADVEAAVAARLAPADLDRLAATVEAHEQAVAVVDRGLAEPAIIAAGAAETPDLDQLRATRAAAEQALGAANREHEAASRVAAGAQTGAEAVAAAFQNSVGVRAQCEPVIRVADLATAATSDAAHRTTLAQYVLLRRFDEMVAAANTRLERMTDGRFALERSDERESGSQKRGLGLTVLDYATGSTRTPGNISGGETFVVSLALALGLADVVQSEAGGVDLGTLFVDEGFGSLDPNYLDLVMTQLDDLRAGGRVVGVVSHVESMKARIPERIEIRQQANGASTLRVRA